MNEAPKVATPAETANQEAEASKATEDPISIGNQDFVVIGDTVPKGKSKGRLRYNLKPEPNYPDFFKRIGKAVGEENFFKCVFAEVIRRACNDATLQAISESKDGKVSDVAFGKAFTDWFLPSTRRSGVHIKDLREKAQELFSELQPLLLRHFQYKPGEEGSLDEQEYNRMLQLTLEYSDLNTKIEDKSRKGIKVKKTVATK
jgi:hypothetical protein